MSMNRSKVGRAEAIATAKATAKPLNVWPGDVFTLQDLPVVSDEYMEKHPVDDVLSAEAGYTGPLAFLEVGKSYGLLQGVKRSGIAYVGVWE